MKSNRYVRDEQRIREVFSQLAVDDVENFERKVMENMRNQNTVRNIPKKRVGLIAAVVAVSVMLLAGSVLAATNLRVFDRFMTQRDPAFAEVVSPVEQYVVDQGIRVDIIAAQSFDTSAIFYLSVRDVSGQNRVTEQTHLWLTLESNREDTHFGWSGASASPLYFDAETNTVYLQIKMQDSAAVADAMNLIINEIVFENRADEAAFPVALTDMTATDLIPNIARFPSLYFPTWDPAYILAPSMGENFPALPGDGWISNVAIIDGYLHVQIATPFRMEQVHGQNVVSTGGVSLVTADGDWVMPVSQARIDVDADLQTLSYQQRMDMPHDELVEWFSNASYWLNEIVFPIDVAVLETYSLMLSVSTRSSTAGDWSMTVDTGDSSNMIRIMPETLVVGYVTLESVVVSPLGITFSGVIEGGTSDRMGALMGAVSLETPDGIILVQEFPQLGFTQYFDENQEPSKGMLNGFARADSPIDVSAVAAVVIGDVRVRVE